MEICEYPEKPTADTASSSSLGAETANQSGQLNVCYISTYLQKVIPFPIKHINFFLKKGKTRSSERKNFFDQLFF